MADVGVTPYNTSAPATGGDSLGNLNVYYDVSVKRGLIVGFDQTKLTLAVQ
jgi:hypothetical protein